MPISAPVSCGAARSRSSSPILARLRGRADERRQISHDHHLVRESHAPLVMKGLDHERAFVRASRP